MIDARLLRHSLLFGIALVSVQGTVYLLQIAAAAQMSAADYSRVRIIESLSAIGALIVTFGIPSVALVKMSSARSGRERVALVTSGLAIIAVLAVLVGAAFTLAIRLGFLRGELAGFHLLVVALSALVSLRLLLVATMQARSHLGRLAIYSAASCGVSIICFGVLSILKSPVEAWVVARVVLELTICLALLLKELREIGAPFKDEDGFTVTHSELIKSLAVIAAPIGASLIVRAFIEHGPVLWLASAGASATIIAQVGIVITIGTVALVPSGVIQGALLPRLAYVLKHESAGRVGGRIGILVVAAACATAVIFTCLMLAISKLSAWSNIATAGVLAAGAGVAMAKMLANTMAGYLLIMERGSVILALNITTLIVGIFVASTFPYGSYNKISLLAVVSAVFAIEGFGATCYAILVGKTIRAAEAIC